MHKDLQLFGLLLAYRLFNVYLVRTYMDPDETWQSLEVAHQMAFGTGYLTWEWRHQLREYAYPLIFAAIYKTIAIFGLDDLMLVGFLYSNVTRNLCITN